MCIRDSIKGACDHLRLGNLTALINKIEPAVAAVLEPNDESLRTSKNIDFVNNVAEMNVNMSIENIRNQSPVLAEMEKNKEIQIIGGMYDISNGKITFFN